MGRGAHPEALGETWPLSLSVSIFSAASLLSGTSGIPRAIAHWTWMKERIEGHGGREGVETSFGYTGVASWLPLLRPRSPCGRLEEGDRLGRREPSLERLESAPIR